ncbi:MAG: serine acetyltransferase [Acidimicrobiales bacterium]|nr:serine acetyltransferase [Acidimicrobiales bacterium]
MGWKAELTQDWEINRESTKSQVILVAFRAAQRCLDDPKVPRPLAKAYVLFYKVLTTWVLGVELPPETEVGPQLRLIHPQGIVVNGQTKIGARVILRASTTIGNVMGSDGVASASPVIGDDVELGANVVMVGPLHIGDGARIGAGAVVVKDVPPGGVAVGNPARLLNEAAPA